MSFLERIYDGVKSEQNKLVTSLWSCNFYSFQPLLLGRLGQPCDMIPLFINEQRKIPKTITRSSHFFLASFNCRAHTKFSSSQIDQKQWGLPFHIVYSISLFIACFVPTFFPHSSKQGQNYQKDHRLFCKCTKFCFMHMTASYLK